MVLDEVEPQAISQDSANAQDRWVVTMVRMQMKMQCRESDVAPVFQKEAERRTHGGQSAARGTGPPSGPEERPVDQE